MTTLLLLLIVGYLGFQHLTRPDAPPALPIIMIRSLLGLAFPHEHTGRATPSPELTSDVRYPAVAAPPNTASLHGEIERLEDGTPATHWYAECAGVTWHFVTAGEPTAQPVLMLHGLPESWWAFHHQIADLAKDHYVIALDCKGYGQSDKRLDLDYTAPGMARETGLLLDQLGIDRFHIVAHDRGVVIADHMTNVDALQGRIQRYVRMQQSFDEPHGLPRPPHDVFATKLGEGNFKSRSVIPSIYTQIMPSNLSNSTLKRLDYEFHFKGAAAAVSKYFQANNFDLEYEDRHSTLFACMTMPILILQGRYDRGQHPEEYAKSPEFAKNLRVQFVEANHFAHIENPTAVSAAIRAFFEESKTG